PPLRGDRAGDRRGGLPARRAGRAGRPVLRRPDRADGGPCRGWTAREPRLRSGALIGVTRGTPVMADHSKTDKALPDLAKGVASGDVPEGGKLVGRVGEDEVLVARVGGALFAIGAHCTHYQGPLGEGLIVGDTVRCPWHHARFCLRTGEALAAPAI